MLTVNEWIWFLSVPGALLTGILLKKMIRKINVPIFALVFTLISTDGIFQSLFHVMSFPFLGLFATLLGVVIFFYNYQKDRYYSIGQYFYRLLFSFSYFMIFVWFIFAVIKIVTLFL